MKWKIAFAAALVSCSVLPGCGWFGKGPSQRKITASELFVPASNEAALAENSSDAIQTPASSDANPATSSDIPELSSSPFAPPPGSQLEQVAIQIPDVVQREVTPGQMIKIEEPKAAASSGGGSAASVGGAGGGGGAVAAGIGPSTRRSLPAVSSGSYLTIGGVVAEVNGRPIFANRVLTTLEPTLSAKAKELDARRFQVAAADLIGRQVRDFIRDEVEFAAAERNLEEKDRKVVELATVEFRKRKISQAGGSLERARLIATENGEMFEDVVESEYRKLMTQLYYSKRLIPRIQISAADMRRYYQTNLKREFTKNEEAEFELMRFDPRRRGSREAALEAARGVQARINAGEDFALLAGQEANNDDRLLQRQGGKVGAIQRGAFRLAKIEEAVFSMEVGQVSQIIEDGGSFYIAKLTSKSGGSVQSFDDPAVQKAIRDKLSTEQFRVMREEITKQLEANAAVRINETMMVTALEMASQRYPGWRAAQ